MLQSKLNSSAICIHNEYLWKSNDGKSLFAQKWDAGENSKAAVLLVHGLGEHSTRYNHWATKLVSEGISVLSFDLRGHGKTPGKQGKIKDYSLLLEDIDILLEKGKEFFNESPLFLYGHSLGGNLVTNYAISRQLDIGGIVLTSPWFELQNMPPKILINGVSMLSKIMPGFIKTTPIKPEHISRELREVHLYKTDKLIHDKISLGFLKDAFDKGKIAKRSIYKINSPLLIMHGSEDQITSCQASRDFIRNASKNTTYIEWKGCYHELHNDIDRDMVFFSLVNWIHDQIKLSNAELTNQG